MEHRSHWKEVICDKGKFGKKWDLSYRNVDYSWYCNMILNSFVHVCIFFKYEFFFWRVFLSFFFFFLCNFVVQWPEKSLIYQSTSEESRGTRLDMWLLPKLLLFCLESNSIQNWMQRKDVWWVTLHFFVMSGER